MLSVRYVTRFFSIFNAFASSILVKLRYDEYSISDYFRKQGAIIGKGCRFDIFCLTTRPYLVECGDHVWIAQGVVLHTHDGGSWIARDEDPTIDLFGKIIIEDNCMIGSNAQILPNVRIGKNSIIGAGSIVINDIPPNSVAMGIPARVIGSSIKYREKCISLWKIQKPPGWPFKNRNQRIKGSKKHLLEVLSRKDSQD